MFENLLSKINFEYELFVEYLKAVSRPEIISRSYEIAYKEALYRKITTLLKEKTLTSDDTRYKYLMNTENSIDFLYMMAKSKSLLSLEDGELTDVVWGKLYNSIIF